MAPFQGSNTFLERRMRAEETFQSAVDTEGRHFVGQGFRLVYALQRTQGVCHLALAREVGPACIGPVLPGDEARPVTPKQAALVVLGLFEV